VAKDDQESRDAPVWARRDAFPEAPPGWGWQDPKGRRHRCDSLAALIAVIRDDRDAQVMLAWTPEQAHLVLPEELPEAKEAVLAARRRHATGDLFDSHERLRWFGWLLGGLCVYMLYQGWMHAPLPASPGERLAFAMHAATRSMSLGIALLMFLILAFIPWYQARKNLREALEWTAQDTAAVVPVLRFETWLRAQRAPVTWLVLGLVCLVGLAQLLPGNSLMAAGLVKQAYLRGEWWRLFTAPLLHGNLVHFLMNAAAMIYLGRRIEVFARWPHVPLVFLFAACVGGETSARFTAATSVGSSGGLMGWLGFLLVFESLHARLVPRSARRRLVAGVLLTALIGLVGFRLIDNAAHAGGLVAGMLYALIVFPKSSSPIRPSATYVDRIAGAAALGLLVASAALAVWRMVAG
jgi:membrane associated rhomboid family serine protease